MPIKLRIEELRVQRNLSKSKLQREAGITMPQLTRYLENDTESVVLDSLYRIAKVLGVKVADLFEDDLPTPEITGGAKA